MGTCRWSRSHGRKYYLRQWLVQLVQPCTWVRNVCRSGTFTTTCHHYFHHSRLLLATLGSMLLCVISAVVDCCPLSEFVAPVSSPRSCLQLCLSTCYIWSRNAEKNPVPYHESTQHISNCTVAVSGN